MAVHRWKKGAVYEESHPHWADGLPENTLTEGSGVLEEGDVLGEGGLGSVIKVKARRDGPEYVLKRAHPESEVSSSCGMSGVCDMSV